jgi:hypothetical protein
MAAAAARAALVAMQKRKKKKEKMFMNISSNINFDEDDRMFLSESLAENMNTCFLSLLALETGEINRVSPNFTCCLIFLKF